MKTFLLRRVALVGALVASTITSVVVLTPVGSASAATKGFNASYPATLPYRSGAGQAYDTVNHQLVMFGGYDINGNFQGQTRVSTDQGQTWTVVNTATVPSGVTGMTYDAAIGKVVLLSSDDPMKTYTFSGTNWVRVTTAHTPTTRINTSIIYNATDQVVYLYGGMQGGGGAFTNDLWSFNGTDWTKVTTTGSTPPSTMIFAWGYDPDLGADVIYGGCLNGGCNTLSNQLWVQQGANFQRVNITGPAAMYGISMTYDGTGMMMNIGYDPATYSTAVWRLTGSTIGGLTWTNISPTGAPNTFSIGVTYSPLFYDPTSGALFEVGGAKVGTPSQGTLWTWGNLPGPPDAPAAPSVSVSTPSSATVSWTAPSANGSAITGYGVSVSPGGATCSTSGATSCNISYAFSSGTTYTATVRASNALGTSAYSSGTTFQLPVKPDAPTDASASLSGATATVSWTAPANNGGSAITGYTVTSAPGNKTCTTTPPTVTCSISGLSANTLYTFTVKATNAFGTSSASSASNSVGTASTPGAPTSVVATPGGRQATVSWTAPASDGGAAILSYTATSSPGNKTCIATAPATSCDVTGLTANGNYTFTVVATNVIGNSVASSASTSVKVLDAPSAPTGVTATAGQFGNNLGQLTVSWTAPTSNGGAALSSYTATLSPGGATCTATAPTTSCVVKGASNAGLAYNTAYTVSVTATNSVNATSPAGTTTATLSNLPVAPVIQTPIVSYSTNYYGVYQAAISAIVNCPTYWGSTVGSVSISLTGSASYPVSQSYSQSSTICGSTIYFTQLPAFGSFTLAAQATNGAGSSTISSKIIKTDGPLPKPQVLVSLNPTTKVLTIKVTAATKGQGLTFAVSDATTNRQVCSSTDASFSCTESVDVSSGVGVIAQADVYVKATSTNSYGDQSWEYPVTINRFACPPSNTNCSTIGGTYYQLNRANFSGMDLSYASFAYASISNSYFIGATLDGAVFDGATLQGDDFTGAKDHGNGVSMMGAYLSNVKFKDAALVADLTKASASSMPSDFTPSSISPVGGVIYKGVWVAKGMSVYGKDLSHGDFSNLGDLSTLTLVSANLSGAKFTNDNLSNSYIATSNLEGTDFTGVDFTGASSSGNSGTLAGINDKYRDVEGTIFGAGVMLYRKDLHGLDLSNLNLSGSVFINSDLSGVNFTNDNLRNVNIEQLAQGQISFNPGLITGANFTNATMTGMWGISDSAAYTTGAKYISVTGSAPAALPANVTFDAVNHRLNIR